ncbi:TPA_asm: coat protein [Arceuthobium sichuanense virus 5]|nr:TPA_asm: coat protein [Arceuthobium sichuanense virus 5]
MEGTNPLKRSKPSEATSSSTAVSQALTRIPPSSSVPVPHAAPAAELIPQKIDRLAIVVNPNCLKAMKDAGFLGFTRPDAQFSLDPRFYSFDVPTLRSRFSEVINAYLLTKVRELGRFTASQAAAHVNRVSLLVADACMSALYAKLRTIHKQYGTYASRFTTPPSYSKEIELPLPFADAIQNVGVFETRCMSVNYLMIPVLPEGTKHEGRSQEEWHVYQYEAYIPLLKECGVTVKSVDTRVKAGSAWWTLRPRYVLETYDLECILPFLHYSDHSVTTASMFLVKSTDVNSASPIIAFKDDDLNHGVRFREIPEGFQIRSFAALCRAPREEWDLFACES